MAGRSINVACANFTPIWGDTTATLAKMLRVIDEAGAQSADLIVFPEGALEGCGSCEMCRAANGPCAFHLEIAEEIPGPATDAVSERAAKYGCVIVFGLAEQDRLLPTTLYNAAAVVGPNGPLGSYRKVHLGSVPWVTEGITFTPGDALPVFDTPFGPMGVQICYDFWFNPELTRILALKGAQLIAVPVGSFAAPGRPDSMRATALSRAQENLVYVAIANSVGGPGHTAQHAGDYSGDALTNAPRPADYAGHSMVAGPSFPRFGQLIAEGGEVEELVSSTLSMDRLRRFDSVFDWRDWRRDRLASASRLVAREFAALAPEALPGD
jgi:N-carbamoylputrescine amidase